MIATITKGSDPVGKRFIVSNDLFGQNQNQTTLFQIISVTGAKPGVPQNGPVGVFLKATQRRATGVPMYFNIPISEMDTAMVPVSKSDVFWEYPKLTGSVEPSADDDLPEFNNE